MPTRKSLADAASEFAEQAVEEEIERRVGTKVESRRTEDGEIVAESRSYSIRTLPHLLDAIGLPQATALQDGDSEFVVVEFNANVWEQGAKIGNTLRTLPLWQIKSRFRPRRVSAQLAPSPLVLRMPRRKPRPLAAPKPGDLVTTMISPDKQIGFWRDYNHKGIQPFHDRRAIDASWQVMRARKPHGVDDAGDLMDLPVFQGKFPKGPWIKGLTQPAFIEAAFVLWKTRQILTEIEAEEKRSDAGWIRIVPGNHDKRLISALYGTNAEELVELRPGMSPGSPPLVSIHRALDADKIGVELADEYPDGRIKWNSNVWGLHGEKIGGGGGGTVRKYLGASPSISVILGHIHRVEQAWTTTHNAEGQREYMAWSPGCLCRIDGAVPSNQSRNDWQQGFGFLTYEVGGREFFTTEQVRVQDGRALYGGQVFEGRDYTEELIEWAREVGWENADDFAGGRRAA